MRTNLFLLSMVFLALSGCSSPVAPTADPTVLTATGNGRTASPNDNGTTDNNTADNATYTEIDLVSDIPGRAQRTDPNLINSWGIAMNPTNGILWISDNGAGVATLYQEDGTPAPSPDKPLVVTIPPPLGSMDNATPTGVVFNDSTGFVITLDNTSARSIFIFATEDGTLSGWNPAVDPTHAILAVDASATGAVYKGLAIANTDDGPFLYATNFHNGTVDMFDQNFKLLKQFTDQNLPLGFAPFNARVFGQELFVTFAKQMAPDNHDDEAGPGNGFVDVFDLSGNLLRRFASEGTLNSPWGLALAPDRFGKFSGTLLVGNFGDGRVNVFDFVTGEFLDQLNGPDGNPITIDGLWGLLFGKEDFDQTVSNTLFFTAGLNKEADGLFGKIVVTTTP